MGCTPLRQSRSDAFMETINITADDTKLEANGTAAPHTMTLAADGATTVNISGNAGLNLLSLTGSKITKIDASGNTGGLTVDISHLAPANAFVTLTGSSADDSITMGIGNFITGGEGNDTFIATASTGKPAVEASTSFATIMDFGAGDKLTLGSSADSLLKVNVNDETAFPTVVANAFKAAGGDSDKVVVWFQYQGDTFVALDADKSQDFSATDYIVKLSGTDIDLSDASVADGVLTFGA